MPPVRAQSRGTRALNAPERTPPAPLVRPCCRRCRRTGPAVAWPASGEAAGVHDERIVTVDFARRPRVRDAGRS